MLAARWKSYHNGGEEMSQCEFMLQDVARSGKEYICLLHGRFRIICENESLEAKLAESAGWVHDGAVALAIANEDIGRAEQKAAALAVRVGELKEALEYIDDAIVETNSNNIEWRGVNQESGPWDSIHVGIADALANTDNAEDVLREHDAKVWAQVRQKFGAKETMWTGQGCKKFYEWLDLKIAEVAREGK